MLETVEDKEKIMKIELCPETGVGMIVKGDGAKVDLMPDEVSGINEASGDEQKIRSVLAGVDSSFAEGLTADEIAGIASGLG